MLELMALIQESKPNDRSNLDRHYQILITDLEKLIALYVSWIMAGVEAKAEG